jgi:hypothetical protein
VLWQIPANQPHLAATSVLHNLRLVCRFSSMTRNHLCLHRIRADLCSGYAAWKRAAHSHSRSFPCVPEGSVFGFLIGILGPELSITRHRSRGQRWRELKVYVGRLMPVMVMLYKDYYDGRGTFSFLIHHLSHSRQSTSTSRIRILVKLSLSLHIHTHGKAT